MNRFRPKEIIVFRKTTCRLWHFETLQIFIRCSTCRSLYGHFLYYQFLNTTKNIFKCAGVEILWTDEEGMEKRADCKSIWKVNRMSGFTSYQFGDLFPKGTKFLGFWSSYPPLSFIDIDMQNWTWWSITITIMSISKYALLLKWWATGYMSVVWCTMLKWWPMTLTGSGWLISPYWRTHLLPIIKWTVLVDLQKA